MATLQKIRNNAGLLVSIVIGLALLAFIMGDLFKPGSSLLGSQTDVAEIAGKAVPVQLFQQKIDNNIENYKRNYGQSSLDANTMNNLRNQTWEQMVRAYVMEDEYAELGLSISSDELFDMVQGNNIHPQIKQVPIFQNQETGVFDRNLVIQFLKNMELDPTGQAQSTWLAFEKAIAEEKQNSKYNTIIQKGLFVTNKEVEQYAIDKNTKINFDYTVLNYSTVADSTINITDADINKYYKENKDKYKQEEECEINYVTFPVVASQYDDDETKEKITELIKDFKEVKNVEQYVNLNSDKRFGGKFLSKEEMPEQLTSLFDEPIGTVVGPYKEGNSYNISRIVKFENIPDSVKASHILIRYDKSIDEINAFADSLMQLINKGESFAELAKKYSTDGSAEKGGDLGWFKQGAMVKPFNDSCFFGNKGDLVKANTQFGLHIIKITDQGKKQKKAQFATVTRNIEAGSKTYQQTYAEASKFGSANRTFDTFIKSAEKENLNIRFAKFGKNDQYVANLENPRPMIRWAFETDEGNVSEIFEFGNIYVVATVKKHFEKGTTPLEAVRMDIEREVRRQKKAAELTKQLKEKENGANTLQALANNINAEVKECTNADFSSYSLPGLGFEPDVQGSITVVDKNKLSEPIDGIRGVYVVNVKSRIDTSDKTNAEREREKSYLYSLISSRVRYEVYNAIKKNTEIKDNRARFY